MTRKDRISEPWGTRTPYAAGENWPVRVDTHLEEGLIAEDVDRWVQTASILHSNGDALDIAVKDGKIAGVRGRAEDRVTHGRLGPKDLYGWQANASPDRLTKPLYLDGKCSSGLEYCESHGRDQLRRSENDLAQELLLSSERHKVELMRWVTSKLKESSTQILVS